MRILATATLPLILGGDAAGVGWESQHRPGDSLVQWALMAGQRDPAAADHYIAVGEICDHEFRPARPGGDLHLEFWTGGGGLLARRETRVVS